MAHWISNKFSDDKTDYIGGGIVVVATIATYAALWTIGM